MKPRVKTRYQYHQRFRSRLTAKRIQCSNSFAMLATEQTFAPGELHIRDRWHHNSRIPLD